MTDHAKDDFLLEHVFEMDDLLMARWRWTGAVANL